MARKCPRAISFVLCTLVECATWRSREREAWGGGSEGGEATTWASAPGTASVSRSLVLFLALLSFHDRSLAAQLFTRRLNLVTSSMGWRIPFCFIAFVRLSCPMKRRGRRPREKLLCVCYHHHPSALPPFFVPDLRPPIDYWRVDYPISRKYVQDNTLIRGLEPGLRLWREQSSISFHAFSSREYPRSAPVYGRGTCSGGR